MSYIYDTKVEVGKTYSGLDIIVRIRQVDI